MEDNSEKMIQPGNLTVSDVEADIDKKINEVLSESKRQLVGGCLDGVSIKDETQFMSKKDTNFYINTDAMREAGNSKQADNIDAQKNVMLDARASANKAFDAALNMVEPEVGAKAIQVLNYAKQVVYYNNFNNFHQHADHTERGINSQSELDLSWVKTKLASQLADGSFTREIVARERSGVSMVCEDHSLVR